MSTVTGASIEKPSAETADEAGTAPGDRRFRPDVEGLRAVAVILVVLYHAGFPSLTGGFVGVDVFFVISGFVITGLLLRERASTSKTSILAFYGRRCRRILPAATLVIIVTVVASYVVLGVVFGNPTAIDARWTAVFLANFHFASIGTDYLNANQPPSPLLNFWSLAVEEQFYLVYPTIFLVVAGLRTRLSLRARLIAVLVPIIVGSLVWSVVQTHANPTAAYYSPLTRAWELALGALIACGTPWLMRLRPTIAAGMTWIGLAAIGVAAFAYSGSTPYPGILVAVPGDRCRTGDRRRYGRSPAGSRGSPPSAAVPVVRTALLLPLPLALADPDHRGRPCRQDEPVLQPEHPLVGPGRGPVDGDVRTRRESGPSRPRPSAAAPGCRWRWVSSLIVTSLVVATVALDTHSAQATQVDSSSYGEPDNPLARGTALSAAQVERMVAAAPSIKSLPANLAPTLSQIKGNWGGPGAPCEIPAGQSSGPACVFGDPQLDAAPWLLYGDSHAAMWFKAIDFIAKANHVKLIYLAKDGCPAIDLPFANPAGYGTPGGEFATCDQWHKSAMERIRQLQPDMVLISQEAGLGPNQKAHSPTAVGDGDDEDDRRARGSGQPGRHPRKHPCVQHRGSPVPGPPH